MIKRGSITNEVHITQCESYLSRETTLTKLFVWRNYAILMYSKTLLPSVFRIFPRRGDKTCLSSSSVHKRMYHAPWRDGCIRKGGLLE